MGGPKSAAVPHPDGTTRILYCLECPESWFEDFGKGQLARGKAQIAFDPDFAAIVDTGECYVSLTLYGDSNGIYVADLTAAGFEVRDQNGGKRDLGFSYRLVAKRKDIEHSRFPEFAMPAQPPKPAN
jgi:hypothetical protein